MKNNYKKVLDLLFKLGIRIEFSNNYKNKYLYYPLKNNCSKIIYQDTSGFNLFSDTLIINYKRNLVCSFALHEIGHFIITPKQRRRRKDYGIPELNNEKQFKYQIEEIKATMIENELKRLFNFKYKKDLYSGSNVPRYFINFHKKDIMKWWKLEGKILAKTYYDLV